MTHPERDLLGDPLDPTPSPEAGERWPERFADLVDLILDEIDHQALRLSPAQARALACGIVIRLSRDYGGSLWYVPKPDALERITRNLCIWAEHDGTVDGPHGIRAMARRYRLSDQQVWTILRVERALHRRRVQPELPGLFATSV